MPHFDENCTYLKVTKQKNLLRNFRPKFRDCRDWTNFWKSCEKLARRSSGSRL